MNAVAHQHKYVVTGVDFRNDRWLRKSPGLRVAVAAWIGVSPLKAMLFFNRFLNAISRNSHLYVVTRDNVVTGAALMKFPKHVMFGEEVDDTLTWSVLYGIAANDVLSYEHLLKHVFEENRDAGITDLYFSEKLTHDSMSMYAIDAAHKRYVASVQDPIFKLARGPAPARLTFFK